MSRAVVNICEELPETSPKPDALLMRIVEDLLGYATGHLCLLDLLTNSSSVVVKKVHGCLTDEVLTLRSAISVVGVLKDLPHARRPKRHFKSRHQSTNGAIRNF